MRNRLPRWSSLFGLLMIVSLPAAAQLRYNFDVDAQGWQVEAGGRAIHKTDAGKHGGYLRVTDETFEDMLMVAPAEALGDWRAYLGGTVSFAARNRNHESPDWAPFGELTLSGAGLTVVLDIAPEGSPPADGEWHRYGVRLDPALWGPDLATVLTGLTRLTLKIESHAGISEKVDFDEFVVKRPRP